MKKILSYLLLLPVYFYRGYISPMTPPSCRFVPTCSEYAIEAIKKHGPFKGLYLAVRRILRCHPWISTSFTHCLFNLLWCDTNAPEVIQPA